MQRALSLSEQLWKNGKHDQALNTLSKYIAKNKTKDFVPERAILERAIKYSALEKEDKAFKDYSYILKVTKNEANKVEALLGVADCYLSDGKTNLAAEYCRQAIDICKKTYDVRLKFKRLWASYYLMGKIFEESGKIPGAAQYYMWAKENAPEEEKAMACASLGMTLIGLGKRGQGLKELSNAIALAKNKPGEEVDGWNVKDLVDFVAANYIEDGRNDEVVNVYTYALDYQDALIKQSGIDYASGKGVVREQLEQYQDILFRKVELHAKRARAYIKVAQTDNAAKDYQEMHWAAEKFGVIINREFDIALLENERIEFLNSQNQAQSEFSGEDDSDEFALIESAPKKDKKADAKANYGIPENDTGAGAAEQIGKAEANREKVTFGTMTYAPNRRVRIKIISKREPGQGRWEFMDRPTSKKSH